MTGILRALGGMGHRVASAPSHKLYTKARVSNLKLRGRLLPTYSQSQHFEHTLPIFSIVLLCHLSRVA